MLAQRCPRWIIIGSLRGQMGAESVFGLTAPPETCYLQECGQSWTGEQTLRPQGGTQGCHFCCI